MKMQKQRFAGLLITKMMFWAILLIAAACKGQSDAKNSSGKSGPPAIDLQTAVITNNLDVIRQHIAAGSNLNQKDPFGGSSPLISASVFGKPEAAGLLIDAGADINFQNNDGSTALHTAAFFCHPDIVKMLLAKGADKTIKNKYGATAYESVAPSFDEAKPAYEMMEKLLGPMGMKLDYAYLRKTRPEIAAMLK